MINQLVRYAPLLTRLRTDTRSVLEVGSGHEGIASYLRRPCFGVEIRFAANPSPYLIACTATATALPFKDRSVDVVLIMDTMEHIPSDLRLLTLQEACRVAGEEVIVGGPMGAEARHGDDILAAHYARKDIPVPEWLQEHLIERAPDVEDITTVFESLGWETHVEGNESLKRHLSLMRFESSRYGGRIANRLRLHLPGIVERVARSTRKPPFYSWLVTARRPRPKQTS